MKNGFNPAQEQVWLAEVEEQFIEYLLMHNLDVRPLDRMAEWSFPPKVALWSVQLSPQAQVWIICGDVPTDFIVIQGTASPRDVMIQICDRWDEVSASLKSGRQHPTIRIGEGDSPAQLEELGTLLDLRAKLLRNWVQDPKIWRFGLS